jgi:hypothetical protein
MPLPNRGPGRPKGSGNKITRTIKEAIALAFDEVGGKEYLVKVAGEDPRTFLGLVARVIPTEIEHSGAIDMRSASEIGDEELAAIATGGSAGVAATSSDKARLN